MPNKSIVLGSASVGRKHILSEIIGSNNFQILKADIDEDAIGDRSRDAPSDLVVKIALKKAEAIIKRYPDALKGCILITSDEVVEYKGQIREKPKSEEECRYFLNSLSNNCVTCHTSLIVTDVDSGKQVVKCDQATQHFNKIDDEAIGALIAKGDVMYCAGGFTVEDDLLKPYLGALEGELETIIGLPKTMLIKVLQDIGFESL
ncbi:hypothetical protein MP228_004546 [Amoeboaphelidium protococcarum]|nr:hypothetical protein MP228_004546 [Amoeboaphelidium protococcarum]